MEHKKLCQCCLGSKKMIGGGMMRIDCTACKGEGYIYPMQSEQAKEATKTIDKRSKSYQKAIKDLVDLGMTKDEAKAQFDKAV